MFVALPHQVCRPATDRSQPEAVIYPHVCEGRSWPFAAPHSLTSKYRIHRLDVFLIDMVVGLSAA